MNYVLFYNDEMDYIFLDSNSISMEGKTAEMSVDLNGDGTNGDKAAEQVTTVYSFTGNKDAPFEYKGYM